MLEIKLRWNKDASEFCSEIVKGAGNRYAGVRIKASKMGILRATRGFWSDLEDAVTAIIVVSDASGEVLWRSMTTEAKIEMMCPSRSMLPALSFLVCR